MKNAEKSAFGYGFTTADGSSHVEEKGLTKREHFALHLMCALVSNADRHSQQMPNRNTKD